MLGPSSSGQVTLAIAILCSTYLTRLAITPPRPNPPTSKIQSDSLRLLANPYATAVAFLPLVFLALHSALLAYSYPHVPADPGGRCTANGLNTSLFTWFFATAIPLLLNIGLGVPLRLVSYAGLGKNFTFAIAEPDQLITTGIYRLLQHPSYTGLMLVITCNFALLGRSDGVIVCWLTPGTVRLMRRWEWPMAAAGVVMLILGVRTRVRQEEKMLKRRFGRAWEGWNRKTARFIPGII